MQRSGEMSDNTTHNSGNNKSFYEIDPLHHLSKVVTGTYLLTGTASIIGNGLVILIMLRKQRKVSMFRLLLAHLAFCDLLFAVFQFCDIPQWIYMRWVYNENLCKVLPPSLLLTSLASVGSILVIAIERYNGIANPLKIKWGRKRVAIALTLTWLLSAISTSPFVTVSKMERFDGVPHCIEIWTQNSRLVYSTYLFVSSFVIPIIVLVILYGKIILILRRPGKYLQGFTERFKKRRQKDIRVTKLLVGVVIAFVVCVLPNHIGLIVLETIRKTLTAREELMLLFVALIPYPFHCSVNPLIYSIVDSKFRRDVKNLFLCRVETSSRSGTTMIRMGSFEVKRSCQFYTREISKTCETYCN